AGDQAAGLPALEGAATEGEDPRLLLQQVADDGLLGAPEPDLALLGEDLGDGHAGALLDGLVGVDEPAVQARRHAATDRRLAGPHVAGENEPAHAGGYCPISAR